jgi:hypothetical protein
LSRDALLVNFLHDTIERRERTVGNANRFADLERDLTAWDDQHLPEPGSECALLQNQVIGTGFVVGTEETSDLRVYS